MGLVDAVRRWGPELTAIHSRMQREKTIYAGEVGLRGCTATLYRAVEVIGDFFEVCGHICHPSRDAVIHHIFCCAQMMIIAADVKFRPSIAAGRPGSTLVDELIEVRPHAQRL